MIVSAAQKQLRRRGLMLLPVAVVAASGAVVVLRLDHKPTVKVNVLGEKTTSPTTTAPGNGNGNGNGNGAGNNGNGVGNGGGDKLSFTMAASVSGLAPGAPKTLPVQVTNPSGNNGTLTVNSLTVSAGDAVVGGSVVCAGSNMTVTSYNSSAPSATQYVIPKGGSAVVPLTITFQDLADVDQTLCRGKTLPLTLNGTATVTR
jgi:hypothetical protein